MSGEILTIRMIRSGDSVPWGFRLQGGTDFSIPLSIQKVNEGSIAEKAGLFACDHVLKISGKSADTLSHRQAQEAIIASRNDLELTVQRGAISVWKPQMLACDDKGQSVVKHSLAHPERDNKIGQRFNSAAKPFGVTRMGDGVAAGDGQPGAYKAVVHSQYNSPINMYSPENVVDAFEGQTKGIITGVQGLNLQKPSDKPHIQQSEVYKFIHDQKGSSCGPPNIVQSGSFKRLEDYVTPGHSSGDDGSQSSNNRINNAKFPVKAATINSSAIDHSFSSPSPAKSGLECAECCRLILGPFVKVGDQCFLHPDCFKCVTCGTSLKNQGYYSIHNKLYCEIHARTHVKPEFQPTTTTQPLNIARGNDPSPYAYSVNTNPNPVRTNPSAPWRSNQPSSYAEPVLPKASFPVQQYNQSGPHDNSGIIGAANAGLGGGSAETNKSMMKRGHGIFNDSVSPGMKIPVCDRCNQYIRGPYISALNKSWCPNHFICSNGSCGVSLQSIGFVEEKGKIYCEKCYELYFAPKCSKCHNPILGDCLNALERPWHPECFICTKCRNPFGNSMFYMEDGRPYCEKDWNEIFTIKCAGCGQPIQATHRWVEALDKSFHSSCFKCSVKELCAIYCLNQNSKIVCLKPLEGQSFFARDGLPFCKVHSQAKW